MVYSDLFCHISFCTVLLCLLTPNVLQLIHLLDGIQTPLVNHDLSLDKYCIKVLEFANLHTFNS